jgi:hypothetical protein
MTSPKEKAAEFRHQAETCFEMAQRISLKEDKVRMIELAEYWLEMARRAEAETQSGSTRPAG